MGRDNVESPGRRLRVGRGGRSIGLAVPRCNRKRSRLAAGVEGTVRKRNFDVVFVKSLFNLDRDAVPEVEKVLRFGPRRELVATSRRRPGR